MNIEKEIKKECPYLKLTGPIGDSNRKYAQALRAAAFCFEHITGVGQLQIELGEARSRFRNDPNNRQVIADNFVLNKLLDEQYLKRSNFPR